LVVLDFLHLSVSTVFGYWGHDNFFDHFFTFHSPLTKLKKDNVHKLTVSLNTWLFGAPVFPLKGFDQWFSSQAFIRQS